MAPFISWFLYLSWIFLFISVGCLLKWLDMQPHPRHVALPDITSPPSMQHIASYSTERVPCRFVGNLTFPSLFLGEDGRL